MIGHGLSSIGTRMQEAAILWHLYELTESPWSLGALGLVRLGPILFLAIFGGVAADTLDRRRVLIFAQLAQSLAAVFLTIFSFYGQMDTWHLYLAAALAAGTQAFDTPARKSLVPRLVGENALSEALAQADVVKNIAKLLGPVLMGFITVSFGIKWVYFSNLISYGAVILALLQLDPTRTKPALHALGIGEKTPNALTRITEGIRWLWNEPLVMGLVWMDFMATFTASALTMLPIFAVDILKLDAAGYGWLSMAGAGGALFAGGILSFFPFPSKPGKLALYAVVAYGGATILFGLSTTLSTALISLSLVGAMDTISNVMRNATMQLVCPDHLRGRMTAGSMIFTKSGPRLGEAEAGAVAALYSAPTSVVSGGVLCILSAFWIAYRYPKLYQWNRTL
jgi:MFS family permease